MAVKDGAAHFEVGSKDGLQDYQDEEQREGRPPTHDWCITSTKVVIFVVIHSGGGRNDFGR